MRKSERGSNAGGAGSEWAASLGAKALWAWRADVLGKEGTNERVDGVGGGAREVKGREGAMLMLDLHACNHAASASTHWRNPSDWTNQKQLGGL